MAWASPAVMEMSWKRLTQSSAAGAWGEMLVGLMLCAEPGGAGGGDVPTELPAGSAPSPLAPHKVLAAVPSSSAPHTAENHCWNKLEGKKYPVATSNLLSSPKLRSGD